MVPAWPPRVLALRQALQVCTLLILLLVHASTLCRISEFACRNRRCIPLDKYCNGHVDCEDKSDEPAHCTLCNRTYYGDVGKTYELDVNRPAGNVLPFICHLTFNAQGHIHGDLIQLIFDEFHVGRYEASSLDGCPDGSMQLAELGRPFTGGSWCGASNAPGGHAVYYSETSTVTLSIRLYPGPNAMATPFEFRIRYKFVSHEAAVVRFGGPGAPLERGQPVPGTYCSRNYDECFRRRCRLQSPNYPGMYPRNVTCYLSVKQKNTPACKHAMIAVRQESTHKMHIRRRAADNVTQAAPSSKSGALRAWKDCTGDRDHLIFYDGASTDDPVLVKFCGGDWLPPVVTRGPHLLVAFHSSPFSAPLHSTPTAPSPLKGFELDVEVVFVDSDSFNFARDSHKCEFWLNATKSVLPEDETETNSVSFDIAEPSETDAEGLTSETRREPPTLRSGILNSPRHTLPPNTTCVYHFMGRSGDRIWLAFESYWHQSLLPPPGERPPLPPPPGATGGKIFKPPPTTAAPQRNRTGPCASWLKLWEPSTARTLLEICDSSPKLCDHAMLANASRITRPCAPHESYLSSGSTLELEHRTLPGTALHPASFRVRYEFVDTRLAGELWRGSVPPGEHSPRCTRLLRHPPMRFTSPKNVFLFGRGGAANLSCVYRLEAPVGRIVRIVLRRTSFGEDAMSRCATRPDPHTGRPRCVNIQSESDGRWAELRLIEVPWRDVRPPPSCVCDNSSIGLEYESASRVLELHFIVQGMNATEDYADFHFEATFESKPAGASDCAKKRRMRGSGGEVNFYGPPSVPTVAPGLVDVTKPPPRTGCAHLPWLLEATENHSLFVLTWGSLLPVEPSSATHTAAGVAAAIVEQENVKCPTQNRLLLYAGRPARLMRVVCPATPHSPDHALHLFSAEWWGSEAVVVSSVPGPPIPGTGSNDEFLEPSRPPRFLVEFVAREPGRYALHWMEVTRSRASTSALFQPSVPVDPATGPFFYYATENQTDAVTTECPYRCPELDACISGSLWCDGRSNCPSGYDEREENCEAYSLGAVYVYLGGGVALFLITLVSCVVCAVMAASRRRRNYGKRRRMTKEEEDFMSTMGRRGRALTEELLIDPS